MEILGVITARANSRRLPRKNTMLLCGKPMIEYTIEAAQKSKLLSRVILSSDDEYCIEIAMRRGVEVPFIRPAYLATPVALSIDVLIHAVKFLEDTEGYKPDIVVILEPTAPLRIASDIDNMLDGQIKKGVDAAWCILGGMFAVKRDILIKHRTLYGYTSGLGYFLPEERALDINTQHDFDLAILMMRNNAKAGNTFRNKR